MTRDYRTLKVVDDQRDFDLLAPPFNFNAPNLRAHAPEVTGYRLLESLRRRLGWENYADKRLLDFGCGVRFAQTIYNLDLPFGLYVGVDVHAASIAWLQENACDPRFKFVHIDTPNAIYNPNGAVTDIDALAAAGVPECDAASMFSVITHQRPDEARLSFTRLRRRVACGGKLYFTAFVDEAIGDYVEGDAKQPGHKSTYHPAALMDLVETCGWRTISIHHRTKLQQTPFLCAAI
ncbi:MAG TPA: class I SAM-dependent methyltransferase [Caulobacterales bacterium]|nr:class I SAM-dependent methyltransferase [Caulobacterales bacterium]